jgi:hypothetical protein
MLTPLIAMIISWLMEKVFTKEVDRGYLGIKWTDRVTPDWVILFCIILFFGSLFGALYAGETVETTPRSVRTPIYNLSDATRLSGSFILGSGTINERSHYFFYINDGDGYRLDSRESSALIVMDESESPYVEDIYQDYPYDHNDWQFYFMFRLSRPTPEVVFHVPPGTIITSFIVDMQ